MVLLIFLFIKKATSEIYTLSLHDALPISRCAQAALRAVPHQEAFAEAKASALRALAMDSSSADAQVALDRKSTRLNSSHSQISYAVFCMKKKTYVTSYKQKYSYLFNILMN